MTKKEALLSMLPVSLPDNLIEKVLTDKDVNGVATYSTTNEKEVDMIYVELLSFVIIQPELSEGGLSLKVVRGRCIAERNRILKKHDIDIADTNYTGGNSIIRNGSKQW